MGPHMKMWFPNGISIPYAKFWKLTQMSFCHRSVLLVTRFQITVIGQAVNMQQLFHIFLSPSLSPLNPQYLNPTDVRKSSLSQLFSKTLKTVWTRCWAAVSYGFENKKEPEKHPQNWKTAIVIYVYSTSLLQLKTGGTHRPSCRLFGKSEKGPCALYSCLHLLGS